MQALMQAVFNRWNATGLDASVAMLYPAGGAPSSRHATGGSSEDSPVPRAEYGVHVPAPSAKSRNSRVHQAAVEIKVWGRTASTVAQYISAIRAAFVNSDAAETSPMAMTNGDILEVDDGGSFCVKVDDNIQLGRQLLVIRHRLNNVTPG